ncbi:TPA: Holliday junction branch migration protein RuvA [Candidatus Uhrbacteria bacterium]|nr:Holliday junction branch migration protein RuvA [Candidatus Uhrbacteria bacterium]
MIASLQGIVIYRGKGFVIVENTGVGYQVFIPDVATPHEGSKVLLYTHEAVREDARELFGFFSVEALELFWNLLSVSGVGARSGQKIVYAATPREVRDAIQKENLAFFTSVQGIGKKTAQKIILELKGVLTDGTQGPTLDQDAVEALVSLGYARRQVEEILAMVDGDQTEDRVRRALQLLGGAR